MDLTVAGRSARIDKCTRVQNSITSSKSSLFVALPSETFVLYDFEPLLLCVLAHVSCIGQDMITRCPLHMITRSL